MGIAQICNIVAWILCVVVGAAMFSDFVREELRARKEVREKEDEIQGEKK